LNYINYISFGFLQFLNHALQPSQNDPENSAQEEEIDALKERLKEFEQLGDVAAP